MAANVLVVDDSSIMRRMIRRTLEISGLDIGEVFEAGNGIEAFACLDGNPVDVVLLDINMPVMTGMQFVRRLGDDPRLRDVPIFIASTEGSEVRIGQLLTAGARGFIRKPFHPEQLRDLLAPCIRLKTEAVGEAERF